MIVTEPFTEWEDLETDLSNWPFWKGWIPRPESSEDSSFQQSCGRAFFTLYNIYILYILWWNIVYLMQIFQALIEMAWWARLKVLPSNVLMFFPSALFRSKKTFQKCLKMGNTHFMYGNFNEQWWWSSGIRWIWGYPNPIFTETKKAQGTGSHHPSPSIRPLGLRGKEFGWLADDLQQPTKTHFGYSKIKKKKAVCSSIRALKNSRQHFQKLRPRFHLAKPGGLWSSVIPYWESLGIRYWTPNFSDPACARNLCEHLRG